MVGIDMHAALQIATARGCDVGVLSELLTAMEAGLIETLAPTQAGLAEV